MAQTDSVTRVFSLGVSMFVGCSPLPVSLVGLTTSMEFPRSNVLGGYAAMQQGRKMAAVALIVALTITSGTGIPLFDVKNLLPLVFSMLKTCALISYVNLSLSFALIVYKKGWSFATEFLALCV